HQIALLGLMPWCARIESGGPVLDGVEAVPRQGLRHGKRCTREGLGRKSLHRIAVDGVDLCTCIAHAALVSRSTVAWLGGARKSAIASTAAIGKLPHSLEASPVGLGPIDRAQVFGLGQRRRRPPRAAGASGGRGS